MKTMTNNTIKRIKLGVFFVSLIPLLKLVIAAFTVGLGANPIEKITHETGYWTLAFILLGLAITPIRHLSGWNWVVRLRRMLGLFAFFYACLHFLNYLVIDQFFDWDAIVEDVIKRPYILVGSLAFLILIPLAITSNDSLIRKLGGKTWRSLHKLVYISAILGVIHFCWLVKKDLTNPLIFAVLLSILLLFRFVYSYQKLLAKHNNYGIGHIPIQQENKAKFKQKC